MTVFQSFRHNKYLYFFCATPCFLALSVHAALSENSVPLNKLNEEIKWLQEETLVSTATKTLEKINKSGSTVSVITARELENMGARNLMDALKRVPGIGITQSNIGMAEVEVRGVKSAFSEKVLLLVDGHPTNNNLVNGGAFSAYGQLAIINIAQVEIVRGPGSALYGTNAFVAVINVITKKSDALKGVKASIGHGSFNTTQVNVLASNGKSHHQVKNGAFGVIADINVLDTDGFQGKVDADATKSSGHSVYDNRQYDLSVNAAISDYSFQGKYVKRRAGPYLGIANALANGSKQEYIDYFLTFKVDKELTDIFSIQAKVYFDHFQFDNRWTLFPEGFGGGAYPQGVLARSPIKHDKLGTEVQFDFHFSDTNKLISGFSFERQRQYAVRFWANFNPLTFAPLSSFQNIADRWNWNETHDRRVKAIFVQDIWDMHEDVRLIVGGRYDHYSDFGGTFNPRSSLTWDVSQQYNFVFSYGSAFRAPTFGELYNINNPAIVGNPSVKPEKISTLELSLNAGIAKRTELRTTVFQNKIKELIAPTSSSSAVNMSGNVGKISVKGVELELKTRLQGGSDVSFNYTYQNPKNDITGNRVPEVPVQKANLAFNYRYNKIWNAYTGLLYKGKTERAATDTRASVPAYVTFDFALNARDIVKNLDLKISLYNALNKAYFDPSPAGVMNSDYPKAGRSLFLEGEYAF